MYDSGSGNMELVMVTRRYGWIGTRLAFSHSLIITNVIPGINTNLESLSFRFHVKSLSNGSEAETMENVSPFLVEGEYVPRRATFLRYNNIPPIVCSYFTIELASSSNIAFYARNYCVLSRIRVRIIA